MSKKLIFYCGISAILIFPILCMIINPCSNGNPSGLHAENDPDAWYFQAGHELGRKPSVFLGHPGYSTKIINYIIQITIFKIFGSDYQFTEFVIKKSYFIQILIRFANISFLFATCLLIYKTTKIIGSDEFGGFAAASIYAASWPTLYFATKNSPEILMNFLFTASLLCLVKLAHTKPNVLTYPQATYSICGLILSFAAATQKANIFFLFPAVYILCLFFLVRKNVFLINMIFCALICVSLWILFDIKEFIKFWIELNSGMRPSSLLDAFCKSVSGLKLYENGGSFFEANFSVILLYSLSIVLLYNSSRKNILLVNLYVFVILIAAWTRLMSGGIADGYAYHYLMGMLPPVSLTCGFFLGNPRHSISESGQILNHVRSVVLCLLITPSLFFNFEKLSHRAANQTIYPYLKLASLAPGEPVQHGDASSLGITTNNLWNFGPPSKIEKYLGVETGK